MLKKKQLQLFIFLLPLLGLVFNSILHIDTKEIPQKSKASFSISNDHSSKQFVYSISDDSKDENYFEEIEFENELEDDFKYEETFKLNFNLKKEIKKGVGFNVQSLQTFIKIPFYKLFCTWKFHMN